VALFWQYSYKGKSAELESLTTKVEELNSQIISEQRLARNLPQVRELVKELEVKLKIALTELPDEREIPDLLASISKLAKDAGLEVSLFQPKPENVREFYAEVPVAITVNGTYHQVATFFDEVGRLSRIVNINQIKVSSPVITEARISVRTDCTATTFRYLDESERAQQNATDTSRRRRG
jgi:type IV pilus assembly protein PilO